MKRVLLYYSGFHNMYKPCGGTAIAMINAAKSMKGLYDVVLCGGCVLYREEIEGGVILPVKDLQAQVDLADICVFCTDIPDVKKKQPWILWQHCWDMSESGKEKVSLVDHVFCLSEMHLIHLKSELSGKGIVVSHFVDDMFKPQVIERQLNTICFVGALTYTKNASDLCMAASYLPHAKVRIYGDSNLWVNVDYGYAENLWRRYSLIAEFYGAVRRDRLPEIYSRHEIVCIPSHVESFSLVSIEAQACGCIPVAHNVGGLMATMIPGKTGILYDGGSMGRIATALQLGFDLARSGAPAAARAFVRDRFGDPSTFCRALTSCL